MIEKPITKKNNLYLKKLFIALPKPPLEVVKVRI